jgi:hypothetical protein
VKRKVEELPNSTRMMKLSDDTAAQLTQIKAIGPCGL